MPLLTSLPTVVAAGLPISSNVFMASMVGSACVYAVIIVFNVLSLKHKSTHRLCVAAVITFLVGLLVADASVGLMYGSDSFDLLATLPGKIALFLVLLAALLAVAGLVHYYLHRHRFRRGKKRATGTLVFSLLTIGLLIGVSHASKGPHAPAVPKTRVALLPETDAYGRPLPATPAPATPEPVPATPVPATPRPATPLPVATPPKPIATPTPSRLIPTIINP